MKEAISGMGLYMIVILFIALFATYVSVTTSYSRCFRIKDEIVQVLEYYRGVNTDATTKINALLKEGGYVSQHDCPDGYSGFSRNETAIMSSYASKPNYCIRKTVVADNGAGAIAGGPATTTVAGIGLYNQAYYQVVIFFKLEWPLFREVFSITIKGETQIITNPNDGTNTAIATVNL